MAVSWPAGMVEYDSVHYKDKTKVTYNISHITNCLPITQNLNWDKSKDLNRNSMAFNRYSNLLVASN